MLSAVFEDGYDQGVQRGLEPVRVRGDGERPHAAGHHDDPRLAGPVAAAAGTRASTRTGPRTFTPKTGRKSLGVVSAGADPGADDPCVVHEDVEPAAGRRRQCAPPSRPTRWSVTSSWTTRTSPSISSASCAPCVDVARTEPDGPAERGEPPDRLRAEPLGGPRDEGDGRGRACVVMASTVARPPRRSSAGRTLGPAVPGCAPARCGILGRWTGPSSRRCSRVHAPPSPRRTWGCLPDRDGGSPGLRREEVASWPA